MESPQGTRLIAGRYELHSLLGEGGMASVYRARDITLERQVALKLLFARDDRDRQRLVKQFLREARIAASVQHRNVIHIVDFGTTDDEQPFMVMELLEGETLADRMHREPRLSMSEIVIIAGLTLRGLAAVHAAGIVHRDLKPDNVFLVRDPMGGVFPKILDFGVSRSIEPRSGRRSALTTQEGVIVGTPEYMSPEQARGLRTLDKRTDVYSMGVILYEALTGRLPFANEHVGDLIIQIVTGSAARVAELDPRVPESLSEVVAKAMSRDIEQRFADANEMQQALNACADELGARARLQSDVPPPPETSQPVSGTQPRVSLDRVRTLAFPLDEDDAARVLEATARVTASTPKQGVPPPIAMPPPAVPRAPQPIGHLAGTDPPKSAHSPTRPRRRRWATPLATGVIALATVSAAALVSTSEPDAKPASASLTHGTRTPAAVPKREPPRPVATSAERAQKPTTVVTVELRQVPEGARIEVDGVASGSPLLELARDGRTRVVRVSAQGFTPWEKAVVAESAAAYDVVLEPLPKTALKKSAVANSEPKRTPRPTRATTPQGAAQSSKPPSALRQLDF